MTLQPVKIPQNVYIEDHIVGPLTLRQTIIITVGGGFSYLIFAMLQKAYGNPGVPLTILAWTPCAISVLFALVKINDLSLLRIVFLTLERMSKAPKRTFTPRAGISVNIRFSAPKAETAPTAAAEEGTQAHIQELSSLVDQPIQRFTPATEVQPRIQPTADAPFVDDMHPLPPKEPNPTPQIRKHAQEETHDDDDAAGGDLSIFRDIFTPKHD